MIKSKSKKKTWVKGHLSKLKKGEAPQCLPVSDISIQSDIEETAAPKVASAPKAPVKINDVPDLPVGDEEEKVLKQIGPLNSVT